MEYSPFQSPKKHLSGGLDCSSDGFKFEDSVSLLPTVQAYMATPYKIIPRYLEGQGDFAGRLMMGIARHSLCVMEAC